MNKFDTRPIACLIGVKGSGKTTICKRIGLLLFGESFKPTSLPAKEDDFNTLITNGNFHVLDNVDSSPDWLMDKLALVGTGGNVSKRMVYSSNKLCKYLISCMLCITSRTPKFTRDDIADRIIPFHFESIQEKGFLSETTMTNELLMKRNAIMTEIIGLHIPFILKAIAEFKKTEFRSSFRLADFAEFSAMISKKLGIEEEQKHIIKCLKQSQKEFALRDSPLVELLDTYVSLKESPTQNDTLFEIFNILQSYYSANRNSFSFKSPEHFKGQFSSSFESLKDYFKIEKFKARANQTKYCITKIENNEFIEGKGEQWER